MLDCVLDCVLDRVDWVLVCVVWDEFSPVVVVGEESVDDVADG